MSEKPWHAFLLTAVSLIILGLSGLFIAQALGFGDRFEVSTANPDDTLPETKQDRATVAREYVTVNSEWETQIKGDAPKPVSLFLSIPIVELDGQLVDMLDPNAPQLRKPVSNAWLLNNNLAFLNAGVLSQDPDGDGFTNLAEWEAKTDPTDPAAHPPYADKLVFVSRKQQEYKLKFAARPDSTRFQIMRIATSRWPKRENFYLQIGEVSDDKQFRLESFEEKQAVQRGITVDATTLTITHLPQDKKYTLVRNVEEVIPTYFAEMKFELGEISEPYIKEGDSFNILIDPDTKYRVKEVKENSAVITYQTGNEPEQTVEIKAK